jgi:hypothetical protein
MKRVSTFALLGFCALSLAACGKEDAKVEAAKLDDTLLGKGNDADPAIASALEDQIMVDPALVGQSNAHSVRAPDQPAQTPVPPAAAGGPPPAQATTLGQRVAQGVPSAPAATSVPPKPAAVEAAAPVRAPAAAAPIPSTSGRGDLAQAQFNGCGLAVSYSLAWSARLTSEVPLYPQSRVAEAAGSDAGACRLRAVTFATNAAPRNLIDFYLGVGRKAGFQTDYTTRNGEQMVSGSRGDGAAFYVILTPQASGGTMADLVSNRGV